MIQSANRSEAGSAVATTKAADEAGQVHRQLACQFEALTKLENICGHLEKRLASVLHPVCAAEGDGPEEKQLVPLAEHIREHNKKILTISRFLSELAERVEL